MYDENNLYLTNEDETGIPFIGRAGQLLRKFLDECIEKLGEEN